MKVAIVEGRTTFVVDVERRSGGRVPADPAVMFTAWLDLLDVAARMAQEHLGDAPELDRGALERPVLLPTPQLDIRCDVDGETTQSSNTSQLIFDVPALVEYLSYRVRLRAGDLIFTGTPAGVGWSREPTELPHAGSRIETTIGCIGTLTTRVVGR